MPIKTFFFGYVRSFDSSGENIERATDIDGINFNVSDDYLFLTFKTIPDRKVSEIGISLEAWELLKKGVDDALNNKEKNDVED